MTSVVKLMVVVSVAAAPLIRPPVVPLMFSADASPDKGGLLALLLAVTMIPKALTVEPAPVLAVTVDETLLVMPAPAPASSPPAKVVISELNVAVWVACTA